MQIARSQIVRSEAPHGRRSGASSAEPAAEKSGFWTGRLAFAVFSAAVVFALAWGWSERGEEHLTAEHGLGYALGIVGASLMLLLLLYPLRKRLRFMRTWGRTSVWFRVHMMFGVIGPVLVLYHANFSWGSLNSNVALGAMLTVAASGLIGRFIYARIHLGLYGRRLSLQELRDAMQARREKVGLDAPALDARLTKLEAIAVKDPSGVLSSGFRMLAVWAFTRSAAPGLRRVAGKALRDAAEEKGWSKSVRREQMTSTRRYLAAYLASIRRLATFAFFERTFALWHVLHLPLFVVLLFAAVAHVVAVHMY